MTRLQKVRNLTALSMNHAWPDMARQLRKAHIVDEELKALDDYICNHVSEKDFATIKQMLEDARTHEEDVYHEALELLNPRGLEFSTEDEIDMAFGHLAAFEFNYM